MIVLDEIAKQSHVLGYGIQYNKNRWYKQDWRSSIDS